MSSYLRVWYFPLDPELRIIHAFQDCSELKFPKKYGYMETVSVRPSDLDDAARMDKLLEQGWKICHGCWRREQGLARLDKRKLRPGFVKRPPGLVDAPPRKTAPRKGVTRD